MYGLVFLVVRDLVTRKWGEKSWKKLCQLAKAPTDFTKDQVYDDALIFALVSEASKMLSLDAAAILEATGIAFIEYMKGARRNHPPAHPPRARCLHRARRGRALCLVRTVSHSRFASVRCI